MFTKNVKQKPLKSNQFAHWDRLQDGSLITVLALLLASAAHAQSFLASPAADPGTLPTAAGSFQWRPGQPRNYRADEMRANSLGTGFKASPFVPLDSWIYPAFDRLIALGAIPSSSQIVRPWTRLECARLLAEAHDNTDDIDDDNGPLLAALDTELRHETALIDGDRDLLAQTESVYARFTQIAGTPLRDGFHFGQTVVDDSGRPYGQGSNSIAGLSADAEAGPFVLYLGGEYQYASSIPAYNLIAQQTEAIDDRIPYGWNLRLGTTSRVRTIEAYAALKLADWQLSFGQQSLWTGPDRGTSLIMSNNAEAMPMLRLERIKPLILPSVLGLLGPVHFNLFLARQGGIHFVGLGPTFVLFGSSQAALNPAPVVWGIAATIKPTRNFELGFAQNTIFAGYGRPLTFGTFLHTFSTTGNAQAVDPGKRVTEANFSYRLPKLKPGVLLYTEAMAWDDPLQGKFVARYAFDPGVYLPELPKLHHLDLRLEGAYTDLPKLADEGGYYYANSHYLQGYTNYGQIMGSWVGRQGIGGQASSTYWFSARKKLTLTYRKMVADHALFQGGNVADIAASGLWTLRSNLEFSANGQYERWNFPFLGPSTVSNFTASFGVRLFPAARIPLN